MNEIKITVCTMFGAIGGTIAKMFGGWSEDMATLLIFMIADFITGIIVAGVFKASGKTESGAISSKASFKGICKKCVILLFVLIAYRLDMLLATDYIKTTAVIGFILNEAISIIENAGLMGIPMPDVVAKAIDILKNHSGKEC